MTLVGAAFPEGALYFKDLLSNVLKVRALVGESPAIEYDEAFRQRVSHNELAQ